MQQMNDRKNNYNDCRKISLPYKKFITLELHTTESFALRFHKFYDETIKNKIRGIPGSKFLMDQRCWVLGVASYDLLIMELKQICDQNSIHIEEIPSFIMNLVIHKTPFTGPEIQMGNFNYTNDKFVDVKIEELPKCIYENLKYHQKEAIRKTLKRHGRIIINDSLVS
jgi:hypothetical protein